MKVLHLKFMKSCPRISSRPVLINFFKRYYVVRNVHHFSDQRHSKRKRKFRLINTSFFNQQIFACSKSIIETLEFDRGILQYSLHKWEYTGQTKFRSLVYFTLRKTCAKNVLMVVSLIVCFSHAWFQLGCIKKILLLKIFN